MIVVNTVADLKRQIARLRSNKQRIAFVPTMGNLHAGHRVLMEQAHRYADAVAASVYVNPLQFGPAEDFTSYPRTPDADRELLRAAGVDILFLPDENQGYPRGRRGQTIVEVPGLSDILCGAARPGHFRGVTTVVARLFNLVTPDVALFGKKDYQQWLLIRLMVSDLGLPIEIIGIDTVRADDGLALSSRNSYLSAAERRIAPRLYATLRAMADGMVKVSRAIPALETEACGTLKQAGFQPEYVSVRRRGDLASPGDHDRELVILAAAKLGHARLIDNIELDLNQVG
jgi:pantoate--beta-alanine ligase